MVKRSINELDSALRKAIFVFVEILDQASKVRYLDNI